jgi:hypothetical protein
MEGLENKLIRIIRPGPKPFLAIFAVFGFVLSVIVIFDFIFPSKRTLDTVRSIGSICLLFLMIIVHVWRNRIVVYPNSIVLRPVFGKVREVRFTDIRRSVTGYSAESSNQSLLNIYVKDFEWPVLSLPLLPYREKDVKWLLGMPELKVADKSYSYL